MIKLITILIFLVCIISDQINHETSLVLCLISSLTLSIIIMRLAIPELKRLNVNQIIKEEGPKKHYEKIGTPTMGGLLIVPIGLTVGNIINLQASNYHQIVGISILTIGYMLIGFFDDWKSLINKTSFGISPRMKLILQAILGIVFIKWCYLEGWVNSSINLYMNTSIELGIWIWPVALFIILAESNATNLTDGLDGLASGCGALIFTGLALQLVLREINEPAMANLCIAFAGSWLGFLYYNRNPAKIFMGDTGSLAMGAALSSIALVSNSLWALLVMGGVFLGESLSVILQVSIFKITKTLRGKGKRLFLMAPIHHHFEIKGIKEINIVKIFWIITILLISLSIALRTFP